ncbi:MAG: DUF1330 domain-containing protein [Pseudomonadota bacterium]
MPAYMIAQIEICDSVEYQNYLEGFIPIFERYKGRLLVTTANEPTVLEGTWDLPRVVVMEFPDTTHAQNWIADPEYKKLAQYRHKSARTNLVLVDGHT